MPSVNLQDARRFAEDLVRRSAQVALSIWGNPIVERKADGSPVTQADRQIQAMIAEAITQTYPDHGIIGEETIELETSPPDAGEAEYCWVVDPIDGTRNFVRGFPFTSTSIALLQRGRPVLGIVGEHHTDWTCCAVAGAGAFCNKKPVRVADRAVDSNTLIAVPSGRHQPILPIIKGWLDRYVLRNVGSTCLHMAYAAAGVLDAAFCYECKLWDVAAGALLVEEAGGVCTDLQGRPIFPVDVGGYVNQDLPFLAASAASYKQLLAELTSSK